jgi:hypothetical protein
MTGTKRTSKKIEDPLGDEGYCGALTLGTMLGASDAAVDKSKDYPGASKNDERNGMSEGGNE